MKRNMLFIGLALVIVMAGCAMRKKAAMPETFSNVSVRTSYSPAAEFPPRSRYAFVTFASDTGQDVEAEMIDQRIRTALTDELKKKGYQPGEYEDIHFFVAYTVGLQQKIDVLVEKSQEQGNEWISALIVPNDYVSGALLVQIIDAESLEPVWLGVINADISFDTVSEQQKQERMDYAVHELLKSFPPK